MPVIWYHLYRCSSSRVPLLQIVPAKTLGVSESKAPSFQATELHRNQAVSQKMRKLRKFYGVTVFANLESRLRFFKHGISLHVSN